MNFRGTWGEGVNARNGGCLIGTIFFSFAFLFSIIGGRLIGQSGIQASVMFKSLICASYIP